MDRESGKLPSQEEVDEVLKYIKSLEIVEDYFDKGEIHIERFNNPMILEKIILMKFAYQEHNATGKIIDGCELNIQLEIEPGFVAGRFSIGDFVWNEKTGMFKWKGICYSGPESESLDHLAILLQKAQQMGTLDPRFRYTWQNLEGYRTLMQAGLKPFGGNGS